MLATLRGNLPSHGTVGFDASTLGGKVAMHVIKPFALKARDKCFETGAKTSAAPYDLVVSGETMDDMVVDTLAYLMGFRKSLSKTKSVKPLAKCTEEEVLVYARINGIKGHIEKEQDNAITVLRKHLDSIEKRHPGTKLSILKTREYLLSLKP